MLLSVDSCPFFYQLPLWYNVVNCKEITLQPYSVADQGEGEAEFEKMVVTD